MLPMNEWHVLIVEDEIDGQEVVEAILGRNPKQKMEKQNEMMKILVLYQPGNTKVKVTGN